MMIEQFSADFTKNSEKSANKSSLSWGGAELRSFRISSRICRFLKDGGLGRLEGEIKWMFSLLMKRVSRAN